MYMNEWECRLFVLNHGLAFYGVMFAFQAIVSEAEKYKDLETLQFYQRLKQI
jgi:hypothetical protein